ncbi:glycerophosphoryl diester phosphodiesterase membrane domain-containing protein [Rivularia sp. UHCC 0363]|uniref:glycerophosphoryl diester phosphodiesterase membrane domain-containing protein n=1 Tax=Rivularia sp. UHCC 0363 TaxID=3110244 RepID=UPI002B21065F|nr:glycerophosphoryl diester phosphodiesterase membrane domain-containing protein [Rivularia sp. UHCC 0363]MEA5592869.1 glycerophosphoryl diester phosphodiesterase membrane domain-containing protein [Rivularia sp. UHCC 0363]
MSSNLNPDPVQPLSLGNVISAGLRMYSSHLKSYLGLAFNAYVWIIVPVYGWAKCSAILALISRLCFGELVNQPESVRSGRKVINSRLWQFLLMNLLMLVIFSVFLIVLIILYLIAAVAIAGLITALTSGGNTLNPGIVILLILFGIIFLGAILTATLWIQARLFVVEIPLAIEDNIDATSTISRSWELTKGQVWRIVGILLVGYLITIPIQAPLSIVNVLIQFALGRLAQTQENPSLLLLSSLINIAISLVSAAIVVPFWQAIKATIYYDLRSRREGLGLQLRDHDI